eukprot:CAMPEP_0194768014 /NCGR_PEP_ID=MMETSP0323_2-20130528/38002_1 /TAXON_ID=2866 ORGANISM="Crypthecodinium cohnii, Strain Seligo" /NCGR_SAMPLE_ID=MMETSP0323_2 /ASSEMBLY_ACC=CAM_ASM_000346 /LENGTH=60 /DNA_ID=CAMNT_0039700127 /DNA_START=18 /DNA_END=197 /DNA_ORIENTATION=-
MAEWLKDATLQLLGYVPQDADPNSDTDSEMETTPTFSKVSFGDDCASKFVRHAMTTSHKR